MTTSPELRTAALAYAADEGLPVFPCAPRGKTPVTKRGFHDATTNPATIRRYWSVGDRNIAIPTGAFSGLWILDVDPGGQEQIRRLEAEHGKLPTTRTVITGRSGRHLWFRYTGPIQSSVGRIASHVDVRADRAYALVPTSIHENGRTYTFVDPGAEIAIAPAWLIALTRKKPANSEREQAQPARSSCIAGAYGAAALNAEVGAVAAALPGARNDALNRAAFALYRLVAGGELDCDEVEDRLIRACEINGLISDDGLPSVVATFASGKRSGLQYPRSRWGRM
jgi:hypothetical protein